MRPDAKNPEKKSKGKLIIIVMVLFLILAAAAVIALDVGEVRSQHIMGFVREAPLIGGLLPAPEIDEDLLDEMTEEEMLLQLHVYSDEIAGLQTRLQELEIALAHADARIDHLTGFETRWQEYREASAAFAQMLAHNDVENFVDFFQDIVDHDLVPQDILAAAFAQAQAINIFDEELRMLVRTYNAMEAGRVAEDMERLLVTNQPLAIRILRAMGDSRRGEIFEEMEYSVSARFAILLSTEPPTFAPLVPPPYLPEFEFTPPDITVITPPPPPADIDEDIEDAVDGEGEAEEEPEPEPEDEPEIEPEVDPDEEYDITA